MKNLKKSVKSPEQTEAKKEIEKQSRRDVTVDYFNALKKVINESGGYYHLGDLVAVIKDSRWGSTWNANEYYRKNAYPLSPNTTKVYVRVDEQQELCDVMYSKPAEIPDISILEKIIEPEGLILLPADWEEEVGIIARIHIVMAHQNWRVK